MAQRSADNRRPLERVKWAFESLSEDQYLFPCRVLGKPTGRWGWWILDYGSTPWHGNNFIYAVVAQLAEAMDLESIQCEFESHRRYQFITVT